MKNASQKRFEEARERLADALKNLEQIIIAKIHETAMSSKMLDVGDADDSTLKSHIASQQTIIENLNDEINKIQKSMEEIGKESEFSKEKNHFFADKIFKFKSQGSTFIQAVEADLVRIQEIISE